ncbi:hypothetical protein LMG27177_06595 [Paraburkholderia fynbosensis]|uniref:Uncharacterized protein n=1 Tax=Paraburkholderia fynbosensis TaxID=1200993 RepID=A0A6J5GX47_9BURK|nr:hypothetical protein LMG27177_06595 [Paraburkholderia fynbosensis]
MESETESQRRAGMDNIGVRIFEESNVSTFIARYHVSSLISNLGVCRCWLSQLHPDTQESGPTSRAKISTVRATYAVVQRGLSMIDHIECGAMGISLSA